MNIIIGENCTFDHIFATYNLVNNGEKVLNLLLEGIVTANGLPGPNYGDALQYQASPHHAELEAGRVPACWGRGDDRQERLHWGWSPFNAGASG